MKTHQSPTFYTLLHLKSENENVILAENTNSKVHEYVKCCETLSASLKDKGYELIVLTNKRDVLEKHSKTIQVLEIPFKLDVPADIKFYSAHYKLDVFEFLSNQKGNSVLIDSDVISINEMPENMSFLFSKNIPMCYDITNQRYPAYGREKLIADKSIVMGEKSIGNWFGGEFIAGNDLFFKDIYSLCMKYWDNYKKNYHQLHHQGDEIITSCAIETYQRQHKFIFDVGAVGGITRYWSGNVRHVQKDIEAFKDNFLLHLPADKKFLAKQDKSKLYNFFDKYKKYLRRRKLRKIVSGIVKET